MTHHELDTVCVQGGWRSKNGEPRQLPIVQSTTFKYDSGEQMARLFDLEANGYLYSCLQNPTTDAMAAKIAELEGGTAALLTSSGQAANFYAVFNIAGAGDHVIALNGGMLPGRAAYCLFCCLGFPKGLAPWHTTLLAKCSVLYALSALL